MRGKSTVCMGVRGIVSIVRIQVVSEIPARVSRDKRTFMNISDGCMIHIGKGRKGNAQEALLVSVRLEAIGDEIKGSLPATASTASSN